MSPACFGRRLEPALALVSWLVATGAGAQSTANVPDEPGSYTYALVGIDPVPYLGAGIATTWRPPFLPRTVAVEGGVALPLFYLDKLNNFRLSTGARLLLWGQELVANLDPDISSTPYDWGVAAQVGFRVDRFKADAFSSLSASVDVRIQPGMFLRHWFAAAEVGYSGIAVTNLRFASFVKDNFNDGVATAPREGWYRFPGGYFLFGLVAGKDFAGGKYEVDLRVDVKFSETFHNPWSGLNFPAFVLDVNVIRHFGGR